MKNRTNKYTLGLSLALLLVIILFAVLISSNTKKSHSTPLKIVAAENFWGSLVSQLGGNKVKVRSIVSDPNADPHEYESSSVDARSYASSDYVIENGAGYDSWSDKLLSANSSTSRKVLNVAALLGKKDGDNPHFWYNPAYVNKVVKSMESDLISLDAKDKSYFENNYNNLRRGLAVYQDRINVIKHQYSGVKVAATEDIFKYLADAAGLNLISPAPFMQAISEGNDPPTDSVTTFEQQINANLPKLLVYNTQTITPITVNIKKMAVANNIPVIGISETILPASARFQDWMNSEIILLQDGLAVSNVGH